MGNDSFTTTHSKKQNFINNDNFFVAAETNPLPFIENDIPQQARRHLNDYDFNILKEDAYKDVKDQRFRLEYRISKTEEEIKEINAKIDAAKEINDTVSLEILAKKQEIIMHDLQVLLEIYNDTSFSAKLSDNLYSEIKKQFLPVKDKLISFFEKFISKLPGKLSYIPEVKNSLIKLQNISKNVDELMSLQFPYGESTDKYNQLSKYIAKANNLQSEISRFLK